jgi:hypothetical protein
MMDRKLCLEGKDTDNLKTMFDFYQGNIIFIKVATNVNNTKQNETKENKNLFLSKRCK